MGHRKRPNYLIFSILLALTAIARSASAQIEQPPQAKPWLLAIVDTSSTMGPDTTYDQFMTAVPPPNLGSNSCAFNKTAAATLRITHAKCALNRVITATGDAVFGLMQFAQTGCNEGAAELCSDSAESGLMLVGIKEGNQSEILHYVDDVGTCRTDELTAGGVNINNLLTITWTPLPGALALARNYFNGTAPSPFNVSPAKDDIYAECRPMAVILLTDGIEQCSVIPATVGVGAPARAAELRSTVIPVPTAVNTSGSITKDIHTYVIGFGISAGDASIEAIATAGGTDAPGPTKGFYAANESELSLAFTQIIADAQLSPEICNDKDDNCNGLIDEGIIKFCDKPHGITERTLCDKPPETVCDGQDDNCDGQTDEGLFNDCGFCGEPPDEVCDTIDNDCDGQTDEGLDDNTACGESEGECEPGRLRCINGQYECVGTTGPTAEVCDCKDNDCDGLTDEDPSGDLCPPGSVCYQCECEVLCTPGIEFKGCESGKREVEDENGRCICISDTCDANKCSKKTLRKEGEVICAPSDDNVAACRCYQGECVAPCVGVTCLPGEVCNPKDGRCITNRCEYQGCEANERCSATTGKCIPDLCATADCAEDEVCRDGACEPSCARKECAKAKVCKSGVCVTDACADIECKQGKVCDPDTGECVTDQCLQSICAADMICDPVTGECAEDPCAVVRCPEDQACVKGECTAKTDREADTGEESSTGEPKKLASGGGGGCSCAVLGSAPRGMGSGLLWLFGLGLIGWRANRRSYGLRRRQKEEPFVPFSGRGEGPFAFTRSGQLRKGISPYWVVFSTCLVALVTSGCRVDPVCFECGTDASFNKPDGAENDADGQEAEVEEGIDAGAIIEDGAAVEPDASDGASRDGLVRGQCIEPTEEVCNLKDDDCDGKTDEDLKPPQAYCGTTGVCATVVAKCGAKGAWVCDFPATYQNSEKTCDALDNDCDGDIDEGFANLGLPCSIGMGTCRREGILVCNSAGDGTECSIKQGGDPQEEVCDGIDNDCDGAIDETKSDPGTNPSYVKEEMVLIGSSFWIHAYEVSRPDATSTSQGVSSVRPCSRAGVLPWTSVTYPSSKAACESIGLRLCTENEWQQACKGGSGSCNWSYTPSASTGGTCNDYATQATSATPHSGCNGTEYAPSVGKSGAWLLPTGELSECYADFGAAGKVYDLSGNVNEWTLARSAGVNPLRGGNMNNLANGLKCNENFIVANDTYSLQNTGFRCCADASYQP
jgi:hypothetical protein